MKTNDTSQEKNNLGQPLKFSATVQTTDRLGDSTLVGLLIDSASVVEANPNETEDNIKTTETNLTSPKLKSTTNELPEVGQTLEVTVRTSGDSDWRPGQRVVVEVERNRLMRFDLSSGYNLDREHS